MKVEYCQCVCLSGAEAGGVLQRGRFPLELRLRVALTRGTFLFFGGLWLAFQVLGCGRRDAALRDGVRPESWGDTAFGKGLAVYYANLGLIPSTHTESCKWCHTLVILVQGREKEWAAWPTKKVLGQWENLSWNNTDSSWGMTLESHLQPAWEPTLGSKSWESTTILLLSLSW